MTNHTSNAIVRIQLADGNQRHVILSIAQRLEARGLAVQDKDGLYISDRSQDEIETAIAEVGLCDFCGADKGVHVLIVPDFAMKAKLPNQTLGLGDSIGGWAACDPCHELVKANRRAELTQHAIRVNDASGKFAAGALKGLHQQFWNAYDTQVQAAGVSLALNEFIDGKVDYNFKSKFTGRDARIESVRRLTGMTTDEAAALARGELAYKNVASKLATWSKKFGKDPKAIAHLASLTEANLNRPMPPGTVPHWQQALDKKFEAFAKIDGVVRLEKKVSAFDDAVDLNDPAAMRRMLARVERQQYLLNAELEEDALALRRAEVYSFNDETMQAIIAGARSIPHEAPLTSIDVPKTGAGWFWFANPFPVASAPISSDTTAALLWSWVDGANGKPMLRFSAWVIGDKPGAPGSMYAGYETDTIGVLPSTKWYWPLDLSFHDMIGFNTMKYRETYGPGGSYHNAKGVIGEEATIKSIAELSLFFMMSCVWFKQEVLISAPGHVERHARKRYQREHKLPEAPQVKVIALRRSHREATHATGEPGSTGREYFKDYHIVVDGHNKLQRCGPGGMDRKLIWVGPYPKGNLDAPLKPSGQKVYAVIR